MNNWEPFNAVQPASKMVKDILKKKNIIKMPILSEDKLKELEDKIYYSYTNKDIISIKLFKSGKLYIKKGIVENINKFEHKITLTDGYCLFFSQIVEIS